MGISLRAESFYVELELQALAGGTKRTIDLNLPMSFVVPFDNEASLFQGPYARFGVTLLGGSAGLDDRRVNHFRWGIHAGLGYELELSPSIAWKVVDARLYFDIGTKTTLDRLDHGFDLGVQIASGFAF
jgi:hypothetical protein